MNSNNITVLAVDDDNEDLHLMNRHFRGVTTFDVQFQGCATREEMFEILSREKIDIIFLDYVLGPTSGLELLKDLRTRENLQPVIILTGQGDEAIAAECLKTGASDYVVKKNLNSDVLRHTIETVLRQHELQDQNAILEEELQEARKMESIATLAGGLAHDFNNLLTAIMGESALAQSKSTDDRVRLHLSRVQTLGEQMTEQIRKLMDFSQRRRQPTGFVSIRKVLDDLSVMFDHMIPKTVAVHYSVNEGGQYVFADESALQQILTNLVTNARDAIEGTGNIHVRVYPVPPGSSKNAGEFVCIEVEDSGQGIDPEIRGRIFDPFFTTKPMTSRKGTGLGLALVWQLVEGYGGEISFDSSPGTGTRFQVILPAGNVDTVVQKPESEEPAEKAKLILVVDDEEVLRSVTCDLLEHLGYHTMSAGDGQEAVETYQKHHKSTSLVLLDIAMPNMSGLDCIQKLREIDDTVPVIFASGHDMEVRTEELFGLGASEVVQKPFQMKDLAQRIRKVLNDVPVA